MAAEMDVEAAIASATQSSVKKLKKDVDKQMRKKPDPEAQKMVEAGEEAQKAKDWGASMKCYLEALKLSQNSSVETVSKVKAPKAEKAPKEDKAAAARKTGEEADASIEDEGKKVLLSDPSLNVGPNKEEKMSGILAQPKPVPATKVTYCENSQQRLDEHLKVTGGKIWTRFPPEPNGYLHLGHAKAMNFNFGQARLAGGATYMRFDDTNPTAEKQEYIDSILKNVDFLGNKPFKITYSSDYFQKLYELAVELIKRGKAYVCHQTGDQMKASRKVLREAHIKAGKEGGTLTEVPKGAVSPWRDTSVEENLVKFEDMRRGMVNEGDAFLRMKMDLTSPNPALWDHAAYRVMYHPHPKTGDTWCIYPTYDYTHCIVDSLENITHSLCTLEFETRQAADGSYYWLLDALDLYKPVTWEYSRCNLTHNVMSKRKLNKLVTQGFVNGWDDPRLLTLDGLRRRGYTASALNTFCTKIGVTRSSNTTKMNRLEACIRDELDEMVQRRFACPEPLKVRITDWTNDVACSIPNHPKYEEQGTRAVTCSSEVYINRPDFKEADDKDFFGFAPGKVVHLKYGPYIKCTKVVKDKDGNITELEAVTMPEPENKKAVKGHIQWVACKDAVPAQFNLYDLLFTKESPEQVDGEAPAEAADEDEEEEDEKPTEGPSFIDNINPDSLHVAEGFVEASLMADAEKPGTSFQFERVGFFTVDLDSRKKGVVFNRVVTLKESRAKESLS